MEEWRYISTILDLEQFTVAARSKAWAVFVRSKAAIVGSNPTQGMDICLRLFSVCVVLCVGSGLVTGWSLVQWVLRLCKKRLWNWRRGQGLAKSCRAIDERMNSWARYWMEMSGQLHIYMTLCSYRKSPQYPFDRDVGTRAGWALWKRGK
jgi:hypothetical protein